MAELEHGMSAAELAEWREFERAEWFGDRRADLRIAMHSALLANLHRDAKRTPKPYSFLDFMPFEERPKDTAVDLSKRLRAAFQPVADAQAKATQEG